MFVFFVLCRCCLLFWCFVAFDLFTFDGFGCLLYLGFVFYVLLLLQVRILFGVFAWFVIVCCIVCCCMLDWWFVCFLIGLVLFLFCLLVIVCWLYCWFGCWFACGLCLSVCLISCFGFIGCLFVFGGIVLGFVFYCVCSGIYYDYYLLFNLLIVHCSSCRVDFLFVCLACELWFVCACVVVCCCFVPAC